MSVVANLTVFPIGEQRSLGPYVARAIAIVKESGIDYQLGPMGTALEGDLDRIMDVAAQCMRAMEQDCDRVYMTLTVDSRKEGEGRLKEKVRSVERALDAAAKSRETGRKER